MATSASDNKSPQKPISFSESEIEAAEQLIQLSNGDSEEDHHSSINSCSFSMVQGKQHDHNSNKVDSGGDVASSIVATTIEDVVLAEAKDESFGRRKNKRYRYIEEVYSVTEPIAEVNVKKIKYRK